MASDRHESCASVDCSEGAAGKEATKPPVAGSGSDEAESLEGFTPEQKKRIDDAIAAARRKQEAKYHRELKKAEATYKEFLASSGSLTKKERQRLQENLEVIEDQLRSQEEQEAHESRELEAAYQRKLNAAEQRVQVAERRWHDSMIVRALQDAAVEHDSYSARQIVTLLKDWTKVIERADANGKGAGQFDVVVEFPDKNAMTGQEIKTTRTLSEALKWMAGSPDYLNLFHKNIVPNIGSSAIDGLTPGANVRAD